MELVDIDKVLDSLELKEEELQNFRNAIPSNISSTVVQCDKNVHKNSLEIQSKATKTSAEAADRVKKFVGVSQVLCSLNEYRKNITRLDLIKNNDFTDNVRRGVINDDELHEKDDDVEEEDVDDPCTADESTADENGLSSNSLTTSSSSTFLSGSSPASNIDSQEEDKTSGVDTGPQVVQLNDLTLGLASISLATNNEEQTASSDNKEAGNKQNETESSLTGEKAAGGRGMPVTLDSTMDDISDTELDRMLNEIDTETETETNVSEEKENVESKSTDIKCSNTPPNPIAVSCIPKSLDDALINFDTFSQASTLEFMEDRTDVVLGLDDDVERLVKNDVYKKKPRPTSLDLPARRVNLYSTAGQTPPAALVHDENPTNSDQEEEEGEQNSAGSSTEMSFNCHADNDKSLERTDRGTDSNDGDDPCVNVNVNSSSVCQSDVTEMENKASLIEAGETGETEAPPQSVAQDSTMPLNDTSVSSNLSKNYTIGKLPPIWVPDQDASVCMQCEQKFTLLKRRHHCRACGQVLCSVCCSQKFKLQFLSNLESRVCVQCFLILSKLTKQQQQQEPEQQQQRRINESTSNNDDVPFIPNKQANQSPNPNNPMEYCSKIPPHRQVNQQSMSSCPTVIVPVGVLKKETSNAAKSRKRKSVMFSDGIRPGSDLATLNHKWSDAKHARRSMKVYLNLNTTDNLAECDDWESRKDSMHDGKGCYIPTTGEHTLPPIVVTKKSETSYEGVSNNADLITRMQSESLKFIIQNNFFVFVKICHLKCCINKTVINFTTCGLNNVGNDEIIILLELDDSNQIPKDIFVHLNEIYLEASNGNAINELGYSIPKDLNFLGSREHGGFLYIRSTFQCLHDVHVPEPPFLIGLLIHRFEMPWAKIFPLRLMLRLGAQYRYYPSPHISVRGREPVYSEIAQTIINVLADFQNYTYTIPTIKGMYIHMEDRRTVILMPRNQANEVINAINNSSDQILAMGANFSKKADGHLVCIQNPNQQDGDSPAYSTQAINIQGLPRKVTGASFFVVNKALKSTCGLSGRCSIVEDGLMIQVLPSKMSEIKRSLTNMKDMSIVCGPMEASNQQTEVVHIQWVDEDMETNIGVRSPIDSKKMDGISSIRIHSDFAISNNNHTIKWTEVFMIEIPKGNDSLNVAYVSEKIAKNAALAFLPFLDLLVANGSVKVGLRVTLNNDNVCYQAGSQNEKLPPLYTKALDKELIPTLLEEAKLIDGFLVLELIFNILNVHIDM